MATFARYCVVFTLCLGGVWAQWTSDGSGPSPIEVDNTLFATYILVSLASLAMAVLLYTVVLAGVRYIRMLTCLNNDTQKYFRVPNSTFSKIKEHLLYAPLVRGRHMLELQIIRGWGIGILPTRLQCLILAGIIGMNVTLCTVGIEWSQSGTTQMLDHLRNRTGTLGIVNMIPLVVMAGRNNPMIQLLNVSYDSFNLLHRWFGRIVIAQVVAHTGAWMAKEISAGGWKGVLEEIRTNDTISTGTIGTAATIFILIQSIAVLRHAFYETFLHLHILAIIVTIYGIYKHLDGLAAQIYIKVVIAAWAVERLVRIVSLIYRSVGSGGTQAVLEALPGDAVRVTVRMARPWAFRPGQHMFLTIPSIGLWTSHPFSVAWSASEEHPSMEKGLITSNQDVLSVTKTSMSAIIRRRDGFTDTLYTRATAAPQGRLVLPALVEGPYDGAHSLHSYGTVMLFAGGVGITHQVPYLRDLVTGFANGTVAARRVVLVWVIQSPEHLEWIRPWMTQILALDRRRDILRIQLFVTRPRSTKEIHSPSATVQMFPGRPNVDTLIGMEAENMVGAMGVSVCGTGGLSDDVRRAVRKRQGIRNIDFVEATFSW